MGRELPGLHHKKRTESISLGRVQTATLAILVDHELEILKHESTPFWVLTAQFEGTDSSWNGRWEEVNLLKIPNLIGF